MDPLWDLGWVLGFGRVILVFFGGFDALFQQKFEDLQLRVLSPCKHREIETDRRAVREAGEWTMINMVALHSLISSKGSKGNWRYGWSLQQWIFSTPFDPVEGMIIQFKISFTRFFLENCWSLGIKINGMSDFVTAFHSQIIERLHHVKPAGFGSMTKYSAISGKSSLLKYRWFKHIFSHHLRLIWKLGKHGRFQQDQLLHTSGFGFQKTFEIPRHENKKDTIRKNGAISGVIGDTKIMEWEPWTWCCIERELIWKEVSTTKYLMTYSVILPTIWMIFCIRSVIWMDETFHSEIPWFHGWFLVIFLWQTLEGFIPMIGAMMLATIYIPLRRWAGASIGIAMPLMLSSYEFLVGSQQKIPEPGKLNQEVPEKFIGSQEERRFPTTILQGRAVKLRGWIFFLQYSGKTNTALEKSALVDVFPLGKGGFPLSC